MLNKLNPFGYRGYVRDRETYLYYLESRYYSEDLCRFLNADAYTSTGQGLLGNNMFAYCGNNPVMRSDPTGASFIFDTLNYLVDGIWRLGASVLDMVGYDLTSELLFLSASGAGNRYYDNGSGYAAELIASNEEFVQKIKESYRNSEEPRGSHTFPLNGGDLGAALHIVEYEYFCLLNKETNKSYGGIGGHDVVAQAVALADVMHHDCAALVQNGHYIALDVDGVIVSYAVSGGIHAFLIHCAARQCQDPSTRFACSG